MEVMHLTKLMNVKVCRKMCVHPNSGTRTLAKQGSICEPVCLFFLSQRMLSVFFLFPVR